MQCKVCGTAMVRPISDWYCPKEDDHPAERVHYRGPWWPVFRPLTDVEAAEQIRLMDPFQSAHPLPIDRRGQLSRIKVILEAWGKQNEELSNDRE